MEATNGVGEGTVESLDIENDTDDTTLNRLLRSCANIRRRSKCWRTLSSPRKRDDSTSIATTTTTPGNHVYVRRMCEEQQKAQILERQIWDYRAKIGRMKKRRRHREQDAATASATVGDTMRHDNPAATITNTKATAAKTMAQQQRLLHSKVMDETLRHQQECVLLSRMAMSQPAVRVATATTTTNTDDSTNTSDPTQILVQEAVRCRNQLVHKALVTQRRLDAVKRDLQTAHERGMQLQQRNRDAWSQLQQLRQQQESNVSLPGIIPVSLEHNSATSGSSNNSSHTAHQKMQRLATETVVLKRVLADILAHLDWYNDERLRETLLQLE